MLIESSDDALYGVAARKCIRFQAIFREASDQLQANRL
jgi:hypothetical protein